MWRTEAGGLLDERPGPADISNNNGGGCVPFRTAFAVCFLFVCLVPETAATQRNPEERHSTPTPATTPSHHHRHPADSDVVEEMRGRRARDDAFGKGKGWGCWFGRLGC